MNAPAASAAPFFVGYLPVPAPLRRYLLRLTPAMLAAVIFSALLMSRSQPSPGDGVWQSGQLRTWQGVVSARPYPLLWVLDDNATSRSATLTEPLMLVEIGKFGGGQRFADGLAGQVVQISGYLLERDGRRMIEIEASDPPALSPESRVDWPARLAEPQLLGQVCLRGEIVDSKCYLGAMKPGAGKTHKECATLCVAGGIPPMLVTTAAGGQREYLLLCDELDGPLGDWLLPLVADPVEVSGELVRWGDLRLLRTSVSGVRRL